MRTGRIVVVTGTAGGIGSLVVGRFLANGDTVVATERTGKALELLPAPAGGSLHRLPGNVTSEQDCAAIAVRAAEVSGRVDALVNAAGYFPTQPFDDMAAAEFREVVDVNLTGAFLVVKAVTPLPRGRGWGRVVLVGSAPTFEGVPGQVHYAAAKAGSFGLARSLARVLGEDGITVNVVTPGLTLTEPVRAGVPPDLIAQQVKLRAIPRDERAEDLVGAIVLLASPDADFISGQTVNVDGGKHRL